MADFLRSGSVRGGRVWSGECPMHLMYVDESGDCGFPEPGEGFPSTGGPTRFYIRAGVVVHAWKWYGVDQRIVAFKRSHGLRWDQELKASDIRSAHGTFKGLRPEQRSTLLTDLLETINRELDISIIVVQIEKEAVDARHPNQRFRDPSVRSLELLLERYNEFLGTQQDRCGLVILDAVEQRSDDNLRHFQAFLRRFSRHLDARRIIEGTFFAQSHVTNMLQLADVCANVVNREACGRSGGTTEYSRIQPKVFCRKKWP